jgi:hypothetical protein
MMGAIIDRIEARSLSLKFTCEPVVNRADHIFSKIAARNTCLIRH